MPRFHLAQLNIARLLAPLDSPELADFVANLERINALAEASPGYVWRLKDEHGDATSIRPDRSTGWGDDVIVNMSVWTDPDALHAFAFQSPHAEILRRRREWFSRMAEAYVVLWWIPQGHEPTLGEAAERLAALRARGPSPYAFTLRERFDPPVVGAAEATTATTHPS